MSLESQANFKTAIGTAAADLTTALQDTVLTEMAEVVRNPKHPLRRIEKLFNLNAATGVFTSDDAYITAAYAGLTPMKGSQMDVVGNVTPMTLVSAAVADADPTDVVLTFSEPVLSASNIVLGGEAKVIDSITIAGAVVTIVVTVAYVNGNTITATGDFERVGLLTGVILAAESVTNNVA